MQVFPPSFIVSLQIDPQISFNPLRSKGRKCATKTATHFCSEAQETGFIKIDWTGWNWLSKNRFLLVIHESLKMYFKNKVDEHAALVSLWVELCIKTKLEAIKNRSNIYYQI